MEVVMILICGGGVLLLAGVRHAASRADKCAGELKRMRELLEKQA